MNKFEFLGQRIICGGCGGVTEVLFGESYDAVWNQGEGVCQGCLDAGRPPKAAVTSTVAVADDVVAVSPAEGEAVKTDPTAPEGSTLTPVDPVMTTATDPTTPVDPTAGDQTPDSGKSRRASRG